MDPIYQWLTRKALNGKMDSEVKWNFQKYLVDRSGRGGVRQETEEAVFDDHRRQPQVIGLGQQRLPVRRVGRDALVVGTEGRRKLLFHFSHPFGHLLR